MLATLSPPNSFQMNLAHNAIHSILVHWFAENDRTLDRIAGMAHNTIQLEYEGEFQRSSAIQISLLAPCQVVIVEIPSSDATSSKCLNQFSRFTSLFDEAIRHGTYPTIICLGDNVPASQVVEWLKLGVFTYSEKSSDTAAIIKMIVEAKKHASVSLDKFLRFQSLMRIWNSIESDELVVLKMIFEGLPNKTIASRLKVSQRTIEARRHRIFEKLESKSLPIVVRRICEWYELKQEFRGEAFE